MKQLLIIFLTAAIAAPAAWFAAKHSPGSGPGGAGDGKKLLYYQSAMHPWIKSDKPGRCTICGMELTPVYEGDSGFDDAGGDDVTILNQTQIQVLGVASEEVAARPLVRSLAVSGEIGENTSRHRVLAARVDGRIDRLHVEAVGVEVGENLPLAEIYSPALLQAEREFRQLSGHLKDQAALRLRQMGLTPGQIPAVEHKRADALTSEILAPMGGTVVSRSVYEGQYVSAGQALFEIADFSTMWFLFQAYEQDMPWLRPGLEVSIGTPSQPGRTFTGRITFIDPNFDLRTRSTTVRVEIPNPPGEDGRRPLANRLFAQGVVALEAPETLTVPRSAVIRTGPQALAYVDLGDGAYERRELTLGRIGDRHMEVLAGLVAGEKVVTNGNLLLDGEAEMNRAFLPRDDDPGAEPGGGEPKEPGSGEKKSMERFLAVADAMGAALADDDLSAFNKAAEPAMDATAALVEALGGEDDGPGGLAAASHFHGHADIRSARVDYHAFITTAARVLQPLRKGGAWPAFEVYECGMVDEALPEAPKKGRWIQTGGRPLANPFFGAEMLRCGNAVKP